MSLPKVSVFMVTYNHEDYIEQALDSVLMQTYPNIELVIGEDFSTDSTREILLKYKKKYPEKIKLLLNTVNIGAQQNCINTRKHCDGNYVALLEGDDYWTDSNKIAEQVEFLENNQDYSICFHRAKVINESNITFVDEIPTNLTKRTNYSIDDIIDGFFLPTASVVYRNGLFEEYPVWFNKISIGDRILHLLNAQHGKIKYLNKCMSAYRVHEGGSWSTKLGLRKIKNLEEHIFILESFNHDSHKKFDEKIKKAISRYQMSLNIEEVHQYLNQEPIKLDEQKYKNIAYLLKEKINNKSIYLFGTGESGRKALKFFEFIDLKVEKFLDNDSKKWGTLIQKHEIISPSSLHLTSNQIIIITSAFYVEIEKQLNNLGYVKGKEYLTLLEI